VSLQNQEGTCIDTSVASHAVFIAYLTVKFGHEIVQGSTDLEHLYRIYSIPTHDKYQWLLLQFIVLLMDAKGV